MYEHNALGYRSGLALCLTTVGSSRARCPATALIVGWGPSYLSVAIRRPGISIFRQLTQSVSPGF